MLLGLTLKKRTTRDSRPHQVRLFRDNALVVVPGRAPLCLQCKLTGHVRKGCHIPRCEECRRYSHLKEDCVSTYAVAVAVANEDAEEEIIMDEAEANLAATDAVADAVASVTESAPAEVPPEADATAGRPREASTVTEEPVPVIEEPAPAAPVAEQSKSTEPSKIEEPLATEGKSTEDAAVCS